MNFPTLAEVLLSLREETSKGIYFIEGNKEERYLAYADLYRSAMTRLQFLQEKGMKPGQELVFQLTDNQVFLEVFWACLLGKIIAVPLEPIGNADTRLKLCNVCSCLNDPYLIGMESIQEDLLQLDLDIDPQRILPAKKKVEPVVDLATELTPPKAEDIAFIQFSSGSTGQPKGVVLTHRNLLTNIAAIHAGIDSPSTGDTFFSWMPLTHDMGLIGFHLTPMFAGWNHFIMPSSLFVRLPNLWLRKISEHQISFTASPNFGYNFVLQYFNEKESQDLDLSSIRVIVNGAEPISYELCQRFTQKMRQYGLADHVIFPVYGLAEASLAAAFSQVQERPKAIKVKRDQLNVGQAMELCDTAEGISFVNVGRSVQDLSLKVTDDFGKTVAEGQVGHIKIKGANVTQRYYNNPVVTQRTIDSDGWLNTGDLGFIWEEDLYVTGRAKEIFFVNGQNYYPHDLEQIAAEVEGVQLGKVVVQGFFDEQVGENKIIAFVLHKSKKLESFVPLSESLKQWVYQQTGIVLSLCVPIRRVPKTTSGKIQRYRLLADYQAGCFDEKLQQLQLLTNVSEGLETSVLNETEEKLLAIWQKIFQRKDLNIHDRFFNLGGDSLKAAQAIQLINQEFNLALPNQTLFQYPTIRSLVKHWTSICQEADVWSSVSSATDENLISCSSVQRRLYYHWQLYPQALVYNVPLILELQGQLDLEKMDNAFRELTQRHEALRTSFEWREDGLYQRIHADISFQLEIIKLASVPQPKDWQALLQPFDLQTGPLWKAVALQFSEQHCYLFLDFHHIIMDGTSMKIILDELFQLYAGVSLPAISSQYRDFVAFEAHRVKQETYASARSFWLRHLSETTPDTTLSSDFARPAVWKEQGARLAFPFAAETYRQIQVLAAEQEVTPSLVLLALFQWLLSKYDRETAPVVGIAVEGRGHPLLHETVGMCVNNLPLCMTVPSEMSFLSYLQAFRKIYFQALGAGEYLFEDMIQDRNVERDASHQPLFDTMFMFQNMLASGLSTSSLNVKRLFFDPNTAKYDLSLEFIPDEVHPSFQLEYSTALFESDSIQRLGGQYGFMAAEVVKNPKVSIDEIQLAVDFISSPHVFAEESTNLVQGFEAQVISAPDKVALIDGKEEWTYQTLNEKSNALASTLLLKGLKPEGKVALLMENSIQLVVGILATLKAGGAFVPIDIVYPRRRKQFILEDSEVSFILAAGDYAAEALSLASSLPHCQALDLEDPLTYSPSLLTPELPITPEHLAYVIYTSGTTGRPKGVMIEHRNIVNYISYAISTYFDDQPSGMPLFTSVAFDLTITSIFAPLLSGNQIIIYNQKSAEENLNGIFSDDRIGIVKLTPSHLRLLNAMGLETTVTTQNLRSLIVGGEALSVSLALAMQDAYGANLSIYNEYGPTEATVGCIVHRFNSGKDQKRASVPIGTAITATQVYILDDKLQHLPPGIPGEIYISGAGVARAYLGRENLDAERFLSDPFVQGQRMYKTGDLARWLNDGTIEYLGRLDQQLKINGHRIELQEVENTILNAGEISEVVVIPYQPDYSNASRLVAFYKAEQEFNELRLEAFVRENLPAYMIPATWKSVMEIPLTVNGKIDQAALLAGLEDMEMTEVEAPSTNHEEIIAKVFQQHLSKQLINVNEDFYSMGGDSISAVQIAAGIRAAGLQIQSKDILLYRTIRQLGQRATPLKGVSNKVSVPLAGEKQLTPIEKWFFAQDLTNPHYYNQSILLRLKQPIDIQRMEAVFQKLIAIHDGLRLNFNVQEKRAWFNADHLVYPFTIKSHTIENLSALPELAQAIKGTFNLSKSLLLQAGLVKVQAETYLLISAHHLIIDGISWRILLQDLYELYQDLDRATALAQKYVNNLAEWSVAINKLPLEPTETEFWDRIETQRAPIPFDHATPVLWEADRRSIRIQLTANQTQILIQSAQQLFKTDISAILTLALLRSMTSWMKTDTCVFELESHGRHLESLDLSHTIGWFTNIYPLLLKLDGKDIRTQLVGIKEQLKKVPNYGLGYSRRRFDEQSSEPFQAAAVRLNYLGQLAVDTNNDLFEYQLCDTGSESDPQNQMSAKIEVNAMVIEGALEVEISHNERLHQTETIQQLGDDLQQQFSLIEQTLADTQEVHLSPSDFEAVEIDSEDLAQLFS
ncbi:MAG: amino acid adenylation domain-containing protein [Saprospiraceae bacterium]|nr:amino acid adenylation domain-containing protein [Saprospiraceae bacterium]